MNSGKTEHNNRSRLIGRCAEGLEVVLEPLEEELARNPDYSVQIAAHHRGHVLLDLHGGPHLDADSLIVPFSVTKNAIGLVVGMLHQRGLLDLDERVATYWPEFAAQGKASVSVRMLLSHQAGIPQTDPPLRADEIFDDHAAAERLAATMPIWYPGTAFGYHALSIGNLASEVVHRITGLTLQQFFEQEIRVPSTADFYLGVPESEEHRVVDVLPLQPPADVEPPPWWQPPLGRLVMGQGGPSIEEMANSSRARRFGHPAGTGVASAMGLSRTLAAAVTGIDGAEPLLAPDTVSAIGQQQVRGYDEVLGQPHRAHAIVFQKPTPSMDFGGVRAFGHDGALGCFAGVDPDAQLTFGFTVTRASWPGGGDPRAIAVMRRLVERLR